MHLCIQLPPFRALLLGPNGSGKTTIGRQLAQKMNVFHISFRVYLQEEILAKMKKPPLVDDDDWEGLEENEGELQDEQNESEITISYYNTAPEEIKTHLHSYIVCHI